MGKRPLTPAYVFFYLLFWPDTWRIVIGIAAALVLTPLLLSPDENVLRTGMLHIMIAAIGYAAAAWPARGIARGFKRLLLK